MNITFKLYECHLGTRTYTHSSNTHMCVCVYACLWVLLHLHMLQKSGNLHNASSSHVYATLCKNNCTISLKLPVAGCRLPFAGRERVSGVGCAPSALRLVPCACCNVWMCACFCWCWCCLLMPHIVKLVQALLPAPSARWWRPPPLTCSTCSYTNTHTLCSLVRVLNAITASSTRLMPLLRLEPLSHPLLFLLLVHMCISAMQTHTHTNTPAKHAHSQTQILAMGTLLFAHT